MHHHPDMLRHAMRAREHELHARAARMSAGGSTRAARAGAPLAEPVLPAVARRGLGALVAQLVLRRSRPVASPAE